MTAIRKVGGTLIYCDTDSIICDIDLNDYPEIKKEFQWDGNGTELGSLKNECNDMVEKKLKKLYPDVDPVTKIEYPDNKMKRKKQYNLLLEQEPGNMSFDSGFVLGCKEYALTKTIEVEGIKHKVECLKCKGYALDDSLNYQMFETMNEGGSIEQTQSQFRCPKSNYVSETSSFNIKIQKVTKRFRKIYTKGIVDCNGVVTPHSI
jgi:hypothetical protein